MNPVCSFVNNMYHAGNNLSQFCLCEETLEDRLLAACAESLQKAPRPVKAFRCANIVCYNVKVSLHVSILLPTEGKYQKRNISETFQHRDNIRDCSGRRKRPSPHLHFISPLRGCVVCLSRFYNHFSPMGFFTAYRICFYCV